MNYTARPLLAAIVGNLEVAGLVVGLGQKPEPDDKTAQAIAGYLGARGGSTYVPYVIVWPMNGGIVDGSIGDPDTDVAPLVQLSCHGRDQEQCQLIADKAHIVMTATPASFDVPNRKVIRVVVDQLPGAKRYDDVQPAEWMSAGRYRLMTTPA